MRATSSKTKSRVSRAQRAHTTVTPSHSANDRRASKQYDRPRDRHEPSVNRSQASSRERNERFGVLAAAPHSSAAQATRLIAGHPHRTTRSPTPPQLLDSPRLPLASKSCRRTHHSGKPNLAGSSGELAVGGEALRVEPATVSGITRAAKGGGDRGRA